MTATRALTVLLAALIALAGCKRKPKDGPEEDKSDPIDTPKNFLIDLRRPPAMDGLSAARVIETFDKMAEEINQDKYPSLWLMAGNEKFSRPGARGVVTVDATARAADIEAAFGRFWAAWESRPECIRQKIIRQRAEAMVKQGVPVEKAREQAEQSFPPITPVRVTTPNPDLGGHAFGPIQADVTNGVKGDWSQNGDLNVTGSVQFSESLRLRCNGDLSAGLRGKVGKLELHANGGIVADLAGLQAAAVRSQPNGNLFLRIGPGTNVLQLEGNMLAATVIVRGNPKLKIDGADDRSRRVVVIHY